jgi:hypothetical protein
MNKREGQGMEVKRYLKECDLMLESWIGSICGRCIEREVIVEVSGSNVCRSLRDDFCPLHGLTIPKRRTILDNSCQSQRKVF